MALFSKKEPMTASDLSHITSGLHQAAAATHQVIAQQYIKLFDQFFDYDPNDLGTPMKAKMVEVALDEGHTLNIPLITLVAPRGLALAAMKVDLSVKMQGTELEKARDNLQNGELASERFFVTFGQDKRKDQQRDPDEIAISMVFKACEPPEAVNRLLEEYTNLISPIRAQPPAGAPQPGASEGEATSG